MRNNYEGVFNPLSAPTQNTTYVSMHTIFYAVQHTHALHFARGLPRQNILNADVLKCVTYDNNNDMRYSVVPILSYY